MQICFLLAAFNNVCANEILQYYSPCVMNHDILGSIFRGNLCLTWCDMHLNAVHSYVAQSMGSSLDRQQIVQYVTDNNQVIKVINLSYTYSHVCGPELLTGRDKTMAYVLDFL